MADPSRARTVVRFLAGLVLAIVVAEAGARVAAAAGPPALRWYDPSTQLKVEQLEALDGVDVVFAGTSMVWQGFDPATFAAADGRSSYNAGLAGGVPVVMEPWLLEQVIPRTSPDLVVWGLSSLDFSMSYGTDNLERYGDALETRDGVMASIERSAASVSALVGYRTVLRDPGALLGTERSEIEGRFADAARVLGDHGERRDFEVDVSELRAATVAARVVDFSLDPADLAALVRTVHAIRAQGINIVFAEMPVPDRFVSLHPDRLADLERVHHATVALGAELGVDVIDLRSGFSDAHFVDFTHLDAESGAELTRTLAARLSGGDADPTPPPAEADTDTILELSVLAAAVNDSAHRLIAGLGPKASSEFWYGAPHYGHARDLAAAAAQGQRQEVVFLGSSLMVNAAVPSQFTAADGRSAFNVAIPATEPAMVDQWIREVVPLAEPDVVVWGVSTNFFRPANRDPATCGPITDAWVTAAELRRRVFEDVPGADDLTPTQLLFGDPIATDPPYVSAIHDNYRRTFTENGARTQWPRQPAEEITAARDGLASAMKSYFVCQPRVEMFASTVARLTDRGIRVVLVSMPISDLQATAFPGGRDQIAEIMDPVGRAGLDAGAVLYVDLSETLGDERFRDFRHLDGDGAEWFTARIVDELRANDL